MLRPNMHRGGVAAFVSNAGGSGGGSAPSDATYVVLSADATLTNERVLTAGSGISLSDGGAGGALTISATAVTLTINRMVVSNASTGALTVGGYWDATNTRIGLFSAPSYTLDLAGNVSAGIAINVANANTGANANANINLQVASTSADPYIVYITTGRNVFAGSDSSDSGKFKFTSGTGLGTGSTVLTVDFANGRIGVGDNTSATAQSPSYVIDAVKNANVTVTIAARNLATSNGAQAFFYAETPAGGEDPFVQWAISATRLYVQGIDNSDDDNFGAWINSNSPGSGTPIWFYDRVATYGEHFGVHTAAPIYNFEVRMTHSGTDVTGGITNAANTANSNAVWNINAGGPSGGDAILSFYRGTGNAFLFAFDNSALQIGLYNATVGTTGQQCWGYDTQTGEIALGPYYLSADVSMNKIKSSDTFKFYVANLGTTSPSIQVSLYTQYGATSDGTIQLTFSRAAIQSCNIGYISTSDEDFYITAGSNRTIRITRLSASNVASIYLDGFVQIGITGNGNSVLRFGDKVSSAPTNPVVAGQSNMYIFDNGSTREVRWAYFDGSVTRTAALTLA